MTYEEFKQMLESASENINKTSRLIEFRGKQKNTKEWCFGFYTPAFNEKGEVFSAIASISVDELLYEPIIPETVGQFTGLLDKHGKKIFEGDIVNCITSDFDGSDKFVYNFKVADIADFETMGFLDFCNEIEIIGNIHDNPELLKEGADNDNV